MQIANYLNFNGACREAFEFYNTVLGGEIAGMMTHADMPMDGVPDEWKEKILHAQLNVNGNIIMGSDAPPDYYQPPSSMYVCLLVESVDEAERIFAAFSEGAKIEMPIAEQPWAERFGMLTDRYGIPWMVNCLKPM